MRHKNHLYKLYISEDKISKKVKELSEQIEKYYKDKNPVIIGVLKGAIYFMMDILELVQLIIILINLYNMILL